MLTDDRFDHEVGRLIPLANAPHVRGDHVHLHAVAGQRLGHHVGCRVSKRREAIRHHELLRALRPQVTPRQPSNAQVDRAGNCVLNLVACAREVVTDKGKLRVLEVFQRRAGGFIDAKGSNLGNALQPFHHRELKARFLAGDGPLPHRPQVRGVMSVSRDGEREVRNGQQLGEEGHVLARLELFIEAVPRGDVAREDLARIKAQGPRDDAG